ncbi:MAG: efflux RND transporter periplasmic adaptor subunit [Wenzhouxiangellaceae bacterium]
MILIIALASWMVSALAQDDAPAFPPPRVEVARAELRELAPLFDVSGTVISLNDSRIAAEVEGVLTWLANVGDRVGAGDVIARIEPRLMDVAVARAQAAVARLRADLEYREQQLRRHEELAGSRHASEHLVDEARAQRDQALHQLADARAQLDRAEGDLERTEIRAPFAGHVVRRLASAGEYVAAGDDVLRLVDTQRLEISLPAPLELAPFIQPGLNVEVRSGETTRRHPVRALVPVGDTASRMVEIRLTVDPGDWLVGTPVQVRLPRATPRTLVAVPRDALVERDGRAFLFRLNDDGVAEQIEAEVAATVGLWVGVASGIEHGDRVVIRGAERLGPGQLVDVIP